MHLSVAIYWPLESSIVSSAMEVSKYGNPSALCEKNFYTGRGQCDQIMSETPNLDVLWVQISLIFGKCRLDFFVAFKAKKAIFMVV